MLISSLIFPRAMSTRRVASSTQNIRSAISPRSHTTSPARNFTGLHASLNVVSSEGSPPQTALAIPWNDVHDVPDPSSASVSKSASSNELAPRTPKRPDASFTSGLVSGLSVEAPAPPPALRPQSLSSSFRAIMEFSTNRSAASRSRACTTPPVSHVASTSPRYRPSTSSYRSPSRGTRKICLLCSNASTRSTNANVGRSSPNSVIPTTLRSSCRSTSESTSAIFSLAQNRRSFSKTEIAEPSTPTTLRKSRTTYVSGAPSALVRSCRARISSSNRYAVAKKRYPWSLAPYTPPPSRTMTSTSALVLAAELRMPPRPPTRSLARTIGTLE